MATFLDFSILGSFVSIFTFLFVFVIVYGMLELFKIFGPEHKGLHAIIGVAVGFMVIFSVGVVKVIETFVPWFTILIIIIFLMIFAARMFGLSDKDVRQGFYDSPFLTWILIFSVIILLFSLGSGFGQTSLELVHNTTGTTTTTTAVTNATGSTSTSNFNQNLYNTLFNPKVLGMILIMLIVVLAMLFLTAKEST